MKAAKYLSLPVKQWKNNIYEVTI